jgi:hypothetical protein
MDDSPDVGLHWFGLRAERLPEQNAFCRQNNFRDIYSPEAYKLE